MDGPVKRPEGRVAEGRLEGPMMRPLEWRRPRDTQHAAVVLLPEKEAVRALGAISSSVQWFASPSQLAALQDQPSPNSASWQPCRISHPPTQQSAADCSSATDSSSLKGTVLGVATTTLKKVQSGPVSQLTSKISRGDGQEGRNGWCLTSYT